MKYGITDSENLKCMASEAYCKIQNMSVGHWCLVHATKEIFGIKFLEIEFGIDFSRK